MTSTKRLEGWWSLVTGASSGIGKAIATQLAHEGSHIVLTARRREPMDALARDLEALGVMTHVIPLDLGTADGPRALVEALRAAGVHVDVLINNAGFGLYDRFVDIPWERHQAMLQLNIVSLVELTHRLLPPMVADGRGYVMNIASIGAYLPTPEFAVYAATKSFVRNFTEALDYELSASGVHAIAVSPGATRTEFTDVAGQTVTSRGDKVMMSAEQCADIAVRKMLAGKRTTVTGVLNNVMMWALRLVPRRAMPVLAAKSLRTSATKQKRDQSEQ